MAKNVPAPLETGDFGGGESGTKQGVRRTAGKYKTRNMKTLHTTLCYLLRFSYFSLRVIFPPPASSFLGN